jgi:hypothetical protein
MAFIVPVIAGALGVTSVIGTTLIGLGVSVALGAAARALAPKPSKAGTQAQGAALSLQTNPDTPRHAIFGEAATAGSLVYWQVSGANNSTLDIVFALADHECESLEGMFVAGKAVTLENETSHTYGYSYTVAEFPGVMTVKWYRGTSDQTADAGLVSRSDGAINSNFRGIGVSYVMLTMTFDAKLYPQGLPSFLFVVRGYKAYDPRLDDTAGGTGDHRWADPTTWEWTDNPEIIRYNWRRGIWVDGDRLCGMESPETALPLDSVFAEANICDESVTLKAGGTEPRYTLSLVVPVRMTNREVLRAIVGAMGGEEVYTSGQAKGLAGAGRSSVMSITDDDLMAESDFESTQKRTRRELVNAVFGTWRDPAQLYELVAATPRTSSADETEDGGRYAQNYDLQGVTSGTQAQRILESYRRANRFQHTAAVPVSAKAAALEAGDWITWTSDRYGWTRTFKVVTGTPGRDLSQVLSLQQVASSIWAWDEETDELDLGQVVDLPQGGGFDTAITGFDATQIAVTGDGAAQIPAILIEWDPIDDPTVDGLEVEYRKSGDTAALSYRVIDASAGNAALVAGVQGGRMVTDPPRDVDWTAWTSTAATAEFVVDRAVVSATTESVAPDSITPEMLSAQARFELRLATALADVQGSLAEHVSSLNRAAQLAAEQTLDQMLAVDENRVRVVSLTQDVDGVKARWGVAIVMDGATPRVLGLVALDGSAEGSTFSVVADSFTVAQPDTTGGDPIQVFTIGEVDGTPTLVLRGNLIADGSVLARHLDVLTLSAITADIGTVTAGRIESASGDSYWDLDTGEFQMGVVV